MVKVSFCMVFLWVFGVYRSFAEGSVGPFSLALEVAVRCVEISSLEKLDIRGSGADVSWLSCGWILGEFRLCFRPSFSFRDTLEFMGR